MLWQFKYKMRTRRVFRAAVQSVERACDAGVMCSRLAAALCLERMAAIQLSTIRSHGSRAGSLLTFERPMSCCLPSGQCRAVAAEYVLQQVSFLSPPLIPQLVIVDRVQLQRVDQHTCRAERRQHSAFGMPQARTGR